MQESVRKLAEEKARKDRKQAHNLEQDAFGGQGTQGPSLEQKGPAGDKTHLKNTLAFKKSVAEQLKQDEAEAKRLNDRHNAQINNPTSDDIAEKGKLQLAKEKAQKESDIRSDNHFNRNQVPINPSVKNNILFTVIFSLNIIKDIIAAQIGIVNSIENTTAKGRTVNPHVQAD